MERFDIGIEWSQLLGVYEGDAYSKACIVKDGTLLI